MMMWTMDERETREQKVARAIEATRGVNSERLIGWLAGADPDLVLRTVEEIQRYDASR